MLGRLLHRQAMRLARRDAKNFLEIMAPMQDDELAYPLVATIAAAELAFDEHGIDVYMPFEAMHNMPSILPYFTGMSRQLQNTDRQALATGPMVWSHTLRGTADHEVRIMAQKMWARLLRGAPFAESARNDLVAGFGVFPDLKRANQAPDGFLLPQ